MNFNSKLKIVLVSSIVMMFNSFGIANENAQLSQIDANEEKLLDLFAAENAKAKAKKEKEKKKKEEENKK